MINYKIVSKTPPSSPTFRLHKTSKFINSAKNIITYPTTYCIQHIALLKIRLYKFMKTFGVLARLSLPKTTHRITI